MACSRTPSLPGAVTGSSRPGETTAGAAVTELLQDDGGAVTGVLVRTADGRQFRYEAAAVVLASGGYQGDRAELTRSIGPTADRPILRSNR